MTVLTADHPAKPAAPTRYTVTLARDEDDVRAAQRLRHDVFAGELGALLTTPQPGLDVDPFDAYPRNTLSTTTASTGRRAARRHQEHGRGPDRQASGHGQGRCRRCRRCGGRSGATGRGGAAGAAGARTSGKDRTATRTTTTAGTASAATTGTPATSERTGRTGPTGVAGTAGVAGVRAGQGAESMTRMEEEMHVRVERRETGRAKLHKYVVTKDVEQTVPVRHEEVRVVREPITEAEREAALSGAEIGEADYEVILHEERPVVETRAVPVERVRLTMEERTENETVRGRVRKERIESEGVPEATLRRDDAAGRGRDVPRRGRT
ncbi:hypothetical protein SHIRM173S_09325 [Streptomyces hirsutus]